jgi:hypothetical protein
MAIGDYSKPTFSPGETLTAAKMQAIVNKLDEIDKHIDKSYIKKAADEVVNNSTTMQDDNSFNLSFGASETGIYEIVLVVHLLGNASAGFKSKWVVSGGVTGLTSKSVLGMSEISASDPRGCSMNNRSLNIATDAIFSTNASYEQCIRERFLITVASAGGIKYQWAQNAAHASDMTVYAQSYLKLSKLVAY